VRLVRGKKYRVKLDLPPFVKGELVVFVGDEFHQYDKGDSINYYKFKREDSGQELAHSHFGDWRSRPLSDIFADDD